MIPFIGPIIDLVGNIFGGVNDHFKAKRELKAAELVTKLAIMERKQTADIDWDQQALINAQTSWKDEYILIIFSIPLIMSFIPGLASYVGDGFTQLSLAPDWYKASIGIMVAGSYGYKKLMDFFQKKKK